MPSLGEVYGRDVGSGAGSGSRRSEETLYVGFGLLATGAFLVFLGGATAVFRPVGDIVGLLLAPLGSLLGNYPVDQQLGIGGVLAGIGIPLAFTGIFSVLPLKGKDRIYALRGIGLMGLGTLLFIYAYPHKWHNDPTDLTWLVFLVYTTGGIMDMWVLFRSVLNIELELPQDSILLEYINQKKEEKTVNEAEKGVPKGIETGSSVGVTGLDTQKKADDDAQVMNGNGSQTSRNRGKKGSNQFDTTDDAEVTRKKKEKNGEPKFTGDKYCGNCAFYEYARDSKKDQTVPYCKYHQTSLDDLEACEEHELKKSRVDKI